MTRSVLVAFQKQNFPNPVEAAEFFLSVRVLVKECPELEARLSLQAKPKILKRRQSTPPENHFKPRAIKQRRISENPNSDAQAERNSTEFIPQIHDDDIDVPSLDQQEGKN